MTNDTNAKAQSYMCDIMVSLLDEMDAVDVSTIDILMENLLPSNKVRLAHMQLFFALPCQFSP